MRYRIIALIVFIVLGTVWDVLGAEVTNLSFSGNTLYVKYSGGSIYYMSFGLDNPRRLVVDILGVSKCNLCSNERTVQVSSPYVSKYVCLLHTNDPISKMYDSPTLRIVFYLLKTGVKHEIAQKDGYVLVSFYQKRLPKVMKELPNLVKEITYRKFKTYEMIVVLLRRKPKFIVENKGSVLKLVVKDVKASKSSLKEQEVKDVSYNIDTIVPSYEKGVYSVKIRLKHPNSLRGYSADADHIYLIFGSASSAGVVEKNTLGSGRGKSRRYSSANTASHTIVKEKKYIGSLISFDVRNADVQDVLNALAEVSGLNFVTSGVKGKITLRLHDVPWDQALDLVLQQEGLVMQRRGNVILVTTAQRLQNEAKQQLVALRYKENLQRKKNAITKVIKLNYVSADYASSMVDKLLYRGVKNVGFVVADKRNNELICHDTPQNIAKIENIVKMVDRRRKAVEISARIVEISKTFEKQIGIQWGGNFANYIGANNSVYLGLGGANYPLSFTNPSSGLSGVQPTASFSTGNYIVNLPAGLQYAPTSNLGLVIGSIPANYNLDLHLSLGEIEGYSKTLSSPDVITLDNEPAIIQSGQEIPYQQSTGTGNTNIAFKNATLKLEVTPRITNNNRIILNIQVSKDSPDYGHLVNGQPPINTNKVQSTVIVNNGETIVLGGLIQKTETRNVSGIPGLMKIPLLGWLFKTEHTIRPESELYIFVTPRIILNSK